MTAVPSARIRRLTALLTSALLMACAHLPGADPLPSWNAGPTRDAIVAFVEAVTDHGGPAYVRPEERIATFDNDGTLWAEQPMYFQLVFALDRIRALAPEHPEWKNQEPFASVLRGDVAAALAGGTESILEIVTTAQSGMTTDEFERIVADWIVEAHHPTSGRLYTEMVYQPMLELLGYLRDNGFETFIVSGGGIDFMRPWTERVYGIPPEQVVGTTMRTTFEWRGDEPVLVRWPEIDFVDDREGKPVGIHRHIGRRPIAAFGNSDGDLAMLQWTAAGPGPRLVVLVHHTDAEREWAYDRESAIGHLDRALDEATSRGWPVIDMRRDWKAVFPPPR